MSEQNDDIRSAIDKIERFLKQEHELYGDLFYTSGDEQQPSKPSIVLKQSTDQRAAEDPDLFGNAPTSASKPGHHPEQPYPREPWVSATTLDDLNSQICSCIKCPLGKTRINFVFGVGNPNADIVVVGEAPGADEDAQGEPFVGRAGQLLNKILEAIQFKREDVYICNILKCRPPNNRDPLPEEIELCEPHLWKQLEIIKPRMILCLGRIAGQALLKTNDTLTSLRGKFHDYRGIKLMVTYHPAALLRNPNWKKPAWEDVQMFRKTYDELKKAGV